MSYNFLPGDCVLWPSHRIKIFKKASQELLLKQLLRGSTVTLISLHNHPAQSYQGYIIIKMYYFTTTV